eukprot:sb/3469588/
MVTELVNIHKYAVTMETIIPVKVTMVTLQDASKLLSSVDGLTDKCNHRPTVSGNLMCKGLDQRQRSKLMERSDMISLLIGEDSVTLETVEPSKDRKRRAVPWNLDRLNDIGLNDDTATLDGSYKDEAEVDVYIVGSGVKLDHSEFENRATQPYNAFSNHGDDKGGDHNSDCDGSGTKLASLAAGRSMGIARLANIKSVKVMHCEHTVEPSSIIGGLQFVKGKAGSN